MRILNWRQEVINSKSGIVVYDKWDDISEWILYAESDLAIANAM